MTKLSEPSPPQLRLLEPNLPTADEILPYLRQMDAARQYTNFGPLVQAFECAARVQLVESNLGTPQLQLTSVSSGTAALHLAMTALGLPRQTKVLVPAFTFPATAHAATLLGLEPVFSDIDPDSWSLTPAIAHAALEHVQVGLVVPVAAFGQPVDVDAWDAFTRATGVPVLVDAAAAFGSQRVGSTTTVCCSLHATKPFGIGEGGVVLSHNEALIDEVRALSNFGLRHGQVTAPGTNAKLSEYHAAVGLAQLARWPMVRQSLLRVLEDYQRVLARQPAARLQRAARPFVPAVLPVRLVGVDGATVQAALAQRGVPVRRWYTPALDRQPCYRSNGTIGPAGQPTLPVTRQLERELLGLPFHSFLSTADIDYVGRALRTTVSG